MTDSSPCCSPGRVEQVETETPSVTTDPQAGVRRRKKLVKLSGGCFLMGSEDADVNPRDAEGPVRSVHVGPFLISPTTVTNTEFATFVKRTGYRTTAEQAEWSYVFAGFVPPDAAVRGRPAGAPWWLGIDRADWRHPEGPGSTITERPRHPVVHVSHDDALAYCQWVGARLPTETEWEYAARGGLAHARYPWGEERELGGRFMCNIWRGQFPDANTADDGYAGTCPVAAFPPNGYGLFNMAGNVWEWSADRWAVDSPEGLYAMRGGSHMCHDSYCNRYRVAARTSNHADSSAGNLGFRVVADVSLSVEEARDVRADRAARHQRLTCDETFRTIAQGINQ